MSAILLVDGENFKGKIKAVFIDSRRPRPLWHTYDFKKLLDAVKALLP